MKNKPIMSETARAVYGSQEKYENHPLVKDIVARIEYLETTRDYLIMEINNEGKVKGWWKIYSKLMGKLGSLFVIPIIKSSFNKLIASYQTQLKCPIGFFVRETNKEFDKLMEPYNEILSKRGFKKYEGN